jgi:uncharacterized protein YraI
MKQCRAFLFLILALPAFGTAPAYAGDSMAASVRLNVRGGPGLDHPVLDTLRAGERVRVNECRNEWCQITHVGIDGWVFAPYLVDATFTNTWGASSRDLPATLSNDTATDLDLDVGIDLGSPRRCPASHPFC